MYFSNFVAAGLALLIDDSVQSTPYPMCVFAFNCFYFTETVCKSAVVIG